MEPQIILLLHARLIALQNYSSIEDLFGHVAEFQSGPKRQMNMRLQCL